MRVSSSAAIGKAFDDPVLGAQRCFRAILAAMSEPGAIHVLSEGVEAPKGLDDATAQALLTLVDAETPVWLAPSLTGAARYIRFHCNARVVEEPGAASFAVVGAGDESPLLQAFNAGDERYPDRSATLIVQCDALSGGPKPLLSGPGIRDAARSAALNFGPSGLRASFWSEAIGNHERYPLGLDFIFTAGRQIACLPRSTAIVIPGAEIH